MDKNKLDGIASEVKKLFCDLLIELSKKNNCLIIAELSNFRVTELEKKDDNDKG